MDTIRVHLSTRSVNDSSLKRALKNSQVKAVSVKMTVAEHDGRISALATRSDKIKGACEKALADKTSS